MGCVSVGVGLLPAGRMPACSFVHDQALAGGG